MFIRALMMSAAWAPSDGGGTPPAPAPAAPAPPATPAFADTLPEDIRGEAAFRDIKDVGALARSYFNAQKLVGVPPDQVVRLPGPDDKAGWDGVYAKLGRPEAADKYAFKAPEGVAVDAGLQGKFAQAAFESGLSTKQAEALYTWWNTEAGGAKAAAEQATQQRLTESTAALKTEWGQAFDQNVSLAKKALQHYGGDKLLGELDANGLGNSPELAKVMAKLGKGLSEDGLIGGGDPGTGMKSPTEAKQEIAALQTDPAFTKAYTNKNAPGHAEAVARMQGLHQIAYPS